MSVQVLIETHAINPAAALEFVRSNAHGATDLFLGHVRDRNLGRDVLGVSYDVFEPLALATFQTIAEKAQADFGGTLKIYISHFKGRLPVGSISIAIAVSSPHRDEAFKACRAIIEAVKHQAPIWKQEHYVDGNSEWVQGHALCQHTEHEQACN